MSPKPARWRLQQTRKKNAKRIRLALLALSFLAAILILGQMIKLTQTFLSPWKIAAPQSKNYLWNGQFNLNFVIVSNSASFATLNTSEKKVTLINIPPQTLIEVPGSFGKWQLRSIYDLGESDKKGSGGSLLKNSLSFFLGLPIDGFLKFNGDFSKISPQEIIELLRKNPILPPDALSSLSTDLTLWELLRLKLALGQIRFDKVEILDEEFLSVLDTIDLPDGSQVYIGDPQKVDSITKNLFDPALRLENLGVAVFNATDVPLLAQKAKRIITNMGGNVIASTNAQRGSIRSYVVGAESKTHTRLRQIFDLGCSKDPKCDKIPESDLGLAAQRAQVVVVLGEDANF